MHLKCYKKAKEKIIIKLISIKNKNLIYYNFII